MKSCLIWALRRGQVKAMIRRMADLSSRLEKFNSIWADAIENVPFYAEWAEKHHLPRQIADLKELSDWPILEKQDLIRGREKLTRKGVDKFHESVTGGATGEPLHFRTMAGESTEVALNKWMGWARVGIYPDSRCFLLWGHRHFYGQGWKSNVRFKIQQLKDWMTNNYRADATDLSPEALRKDYAKVLKFNPECIIAYSASLLALVRTMREELELRVGVGERNYSSPFPALRAIICTAGPLTKEERGEISSFFGVPVSMEYGAMDGGTIAYQTPATNGRYRVFDETHIVHKGQVEKVENCERVEILVTTLTRRYLPLIRYRIGDFMEDPSARDDGSVETFSEVSGRTGDMIDLGDGIRFHGYSLMVCAEENPKIIAHQLVVNRAKRTVTFVAQTTEHLTDDEKEQVKRHAADIAHVSPEVFAVKETTELVKAKSGKIRLVIEDEEGGV